MLDSISFTFWDEEENEMLIIQEQTIDPYEFQLAPIRRETTRLTKFQSLFFKMRNDVISFDVIGEVTIGRFPKTGSTRHQIDLSPFKSMTDGVSRKHVKLIRNNDGQLFVVDLWSANGTYLNEDKLEPYTMYAVDNGDVLRLGKLVIHVLFG